MYITGVSIYTAYIRIHITRFEKMQRESEELVINRSSRLKDNIVHTYTDDDAYNNN